MTSTCPACGHSPVPAEEDACPACGAWKPADPAGIVWQDPRAARAADPEKSRLPRWVPPLLLFMAGAAAGWAMRPAEQESGVTPPAGSAAPQTQVPAPWRPFSNRDMQETYKNRTPVAYTFRGERREVSTFKEILTGLCQQLYRLHGTDFDRVLTLRGRTRAYFSRDPQGMLVPWEIPGARIFVELNYNSATRVGRCHEILVLFGHSPDDLQIELSAP